MNAYLVGVVFADLNIVVGFVYTRSKERAVQQIIDQYSYGIEVIKYVVDEVNDSTIIRLTRIAHEKGLIE